MYNMILTCCDTDAITICKPDMKPFSKEETDALTEELNSIFPEGINWEFEFNIPKMIVLKTKNYLMYDGKKIKIKGSSLKSSTLEPALKKLLNDCIDCLVFDRQQDILPIFNKLVLDVRDNRINIKDWAKKMQLSPTTFNSTRTNETKVVDAIRGTEYKSGDRIYVYPSDTDTLQLIEHYSNNHNKDTFYKKIFKTMERFETIIDTSLFINYSLKKNKKLLSELV